MAFSLLSSLQSELSMSVLSTNVHDLLIDAYPTFQQHTMVQQQILWLFGSLLLWQRSKKMIHKSVKVMEFFKSLVGDPLADKKKLLKETRMRQLEEDAKSIASGSRSLFTIGTSTIATKGKDGVAGKKPGKQEMGSLDESKTMGEDHNSISKSKYQFTNMGEDERNKNLEDDIKNEEDEDANVAQLEGSSIAVAIPVQIRAFVRETQGRMYKEKKNGDTSYTGSPQTFKQRRNFNERPLFGTVETRLFTPGEAGLVQGVDEDKDGNKKQVEPEWAKHLNYGEEVDKEAKKIKRAQIRKAQEEKAQQLYD
jgi:hypothetical protein